jgi:threonine/homoserine/homoserine lactone efflux protein
MAEMNPILLAGLAGFVCALIFAAIPVGPINLTILNEGAQKGLVWALFIGLGASFMDTFYCGLSFTGLSSFFDHGIVKASLQVASFVFLLFLGFKFLLTQSVQIHTRLDNASEAIEHKIERKFHPHSAFMTGVVRVGANLGVLVAWVVLTATLMAHDWVADTAAAKVSCVVGVFLGTLFWFMALGFAVSRSHGKFSEKTLLRVQHISGLCLIATAIFEGVRIAWRLAQHKL